MEFLAIWGACLSTFLAIIKIWEVWNARFRLEVGFVSCSLREEGNTVSIRNLSDKQVILNYWEILWCDGKWPFRKFTVLRSPEDLRLEIKIPANDVHIMNFVDIDYFNTSNKEMKGRSIFFKLYIAGRGQIKRHIYG